MFISWNFYKKRKKVKQNQVENIYIGGTKEKKQENIYKDEDRDDDVLDHKNGKIGASSEKDEMAQQKQNIINRGHVLGTTKTIFLGEQSTGNINTLKTDLAEDAYIAKKTQSKEHINKDQESKEDNEITFSMEESEAYSNDKEDQFQPKSKLGTGKLSARGRRGARGKVGRGKGIEELKGTSGAGERRHHQNREEDNNEENILLAQSSSEDLTFQISGKVYSVNMKETGYVQCPFCETNSMQVRKHFKSCVKNKVGTTEEIPELFSNILKV